MFGGIRVGLSLAAVCVSAAALATGCGDSDVDSTASDKSTKIAVASEPPKGFIEKTVKVLETATSNKDCKLIYGLNGKSVYRMACPAPKKFRKSMASFKVAGAEAYGPGAVIDYTSGSIKDNASIVLFATPDRSWGVGNFGLLSPRSVGTSDADNRAAYRAALDRYLAAVRKRDCKEFISAAFTTVKTEKEVCDGQFKETAPFGKRLKKSPDAKPKYEGGNGQYGFFSIETAKPELASTTVAVASAGEKQGKPVYLVLEWAPGPTTEEIQRVRRALEEQQRQEEQGDTSTGPQPMP
jgi:hypothetical protein